MATYIVIPNGDENQTYLTDSSEKIAAAQAALRRDGLESAPVWSGDPDGESVKTGEILWAVPAEAKRHAEKLAGELAAAWVAEDHGDYGEGEKGGAEWLAEGLGPDGCEAFAALDQDERFALVEPLFVAALADLQ